jgi:hypothetical protein
MKNIWTDERNSLHVQTVRSELCIKLNYLKEGEPMKCNDFYHFIKDDRELLSAIRTKRKYILKKNMNMLYLSVNKTG